MFILTKAKVEVRSTVLDMKEILSNEVFQRFSLERLVDSFSIHDGILHADEHIKYY